MNHRIIGSVIKRINTPQGAVEATIDVLVDVEELVKRRGGAAIHSSRGITTLIGGAVTLKARNIATIRSQENS